MRAFCWMSRSPTLVGVTPAFLPFTTTSAPGGSVTMLTFPTAATKCTGRTTVSPALVSTLKR